MYAKIDGSFYFFNRVCNSHQIIGCKTVEQFSATYFKDSFFAYGLKTWRFHRDEINEIKGHLEKVITRMNKLKELIEGRDEEKKTEAQFIAESLIGTHGELLTSLVSNLTTTDEKTKLVNKADIYKGFLFSPRNLFRGRQLIELPLIDNVSVRNGKEEKEDKINKLTNLIEFFKETTKSSTTNFNDGRPIESHNALSQEAILHAVEMNPAINNFDKNVARDNLEFSRKIEDEEKTQSHEEHPISHSRTRHSREQHQTPVSRTRHSREPQPPLVSRTITFQKQQPPLVSRTITSREDTTPRKPVFSRLDHNNTKTTISSRVSPILYSDPRSSVVEKPRTYQTEESIPRPKRKIRIILPPKRGGLYSKSNKQISVRHRYNKNRKTQRRNK